MLLTRTVNTESILDRARNIFQKGHSKECLSFLQSSFKELELEEALKYRFRNEMALLLSSLNRIEMDKFKLLSVDYNLQLNKINTAILDLITSIEQSTSLQFSLPAPSGVKYRVELELNLDFENTTDEDIQKFLAKIAAIIRTNPDELIIQNKRPGSIILELELTAEEIVKIRSLIKTGRAEILKDIRGFGDIWNWMEKSQAFSIYLNHTNLLGVNLSGANLNGANFNGANLSGANLSGANLNGADLSNADLSNANLSNANLNRADLSNSNLNRADLNWANLYRANLYNVNLNEANLIRADLNKANLSEANLSGAFLSGAFLIMADFSRADLRGTDFRGANLIKADLSRTDLSRANLSGANLSEANLNRSDLNRANLSGANLSEANLNKSDLSEANIIGANLNETKLNKTIFHIHQAKILWAMKIDISKVEFVDDDVNKLPLVYL